MASPIFEERNRLLLAISVNEPSGCYGGLKTPHIQGAQFPNSLNCPIEK
jgi:hypothetical protein